MPQITPSREHVLMERVRVTLLENVGALGDVPQLQVVETVMGKLGLLAIDGQQAEFVGPRVSREEAHELARVVLAGGKAPDVLFRLALAVIALTCDARRSLDMEAA